MRVCRRMVINQLLPPVGEDADVAISKEVYEQLSELDSANGTHLQAYARYAPKCTKRGGVRTTKMLFVSTSEVTQKLL